MKFSKALLGLTAGLATFGMSAPVMANGIISNPGRYDGARLGVQTQRGTNCNSSAPDRASFSLVAGYRDRDYDYGYRSDYGSYKGSPDNGEFVGGAIVSIPFGGPDFGDCSKILELEEARAQLDMATTLFEAGAMTADELRVVADKVKVVIAKQQGAVEPASKTEKKTATVRHD